MAGSAPACSKCKRRRRHRASAGRAGITREMARPPEAGTTGVPFLSPGGSAVPGAQRLWVARAPGAGGEAQLHGLGGRAVGSPRRSPASERQPARRGARQLVHHEHLVLHPATSAAALASRVNSGMTVSGPSGRQRRRGRPAATGLDGFINGGRLAGSSAHVPRRREAGRTGHLDRVLGVRVRLRTARTRRRGHRTGFRPRRRWSRSVTKSAPTGRYRHERPTVPPQSRAAQPHAGRPSPAPPAVRRHRRAASPERQPWSLGDVLAGTAGMTSVAGSTTGSRTWEGTAVGAASPASAPARSADRRCSQSTSRTAAAATLTPTDTQAHRTLPERRATTSRPKAIRTRMSTRSSTVHSVSGWRGR